MSELSSKVCKTLHYHRQRVARGVRGMWWELTQPALKRPIFVVGCSRAGTTLVYKTISQSKEIGSLQRETHDFWVALHPLAQKNWRTHALDVADAGQRDRDIISRYFYSHTGMRRIVDKNNQNGLCVSYLHALFPDAHFVYIKRSPGDNIHSLIEGWGKADEFATWSQELPAAVAVEGGRYRRWCFFLADGWREYLDKAIEDVCAFQYRAINRAIMDAGKRVPAAQWTEIFYEDLLKDPAGGFRRTFEACGLKVTDDIDQHCRGVLSTPYNAFSEIRIDKWRDQSNRSRIERVMPSVAGLAREMGYAV